MRRMRVVAVLSIPVFSIASLAAAQTPFDGTWKIDVATAKFPEKPDQLLLQGGRYTCSTCVPPINIKSDGTDQPVPGSKYFDTMAVTVIDDRSVRITSKKDGRVVFEGTNMVGSDGTSLTEEFTSYPPAGPPIKGKVTSERVEKGPTGAHAISGSWRTTKADEFSDNALTVTYEGTADGLRMRTGSGESYDAKFDGQDYPVKGDRGSSVVALKRIDDRTMEETTKRDGKVVGVARITAAADGKTLNVVYDDKQRGTTMSYAARKQ
jgi:hypothetical protein